MPPRSEKTPYQQAIAVEKAISDSHKSLEQKKQSSMLHMATARDATMLTVAKMQHQNLTDDEIKQEIKKWYKWLRDAIYNSPFVS